MFYDLLKFIGGLFLFCFLPGYFFSIPLKIPFFSRERFISAWACGTGFFTVLSFIFFRFYLAGYLPVVFLVLDLAACFFLYRENSPIKSFSYKINPGYLPLLFVLMLGTILFVSPLVRTGLMTSGGLTAIDHDALWHLAIQQEILKQGVPHHPGFSGTELKNYHYLSDMFFASFSRLSNLTLPDLFFRFVPVVLALMYGFSIFTVIKNYSRSTLIAVFSAAFAYFSSSVSYLAPVLNRDNLVWGQGTFMLDQPFMLSRNLHTLFAIALIFSALVILKSSQKTTGRLFFGLVVGVSAGFKIYPALALTASLGLVMVYEYFKEKKLYYLLPFLISTSVIAVLALITFEPGSSFLNFFPGWLLIRMVQDPDRLHWPYLYLAEDTYRVHHNFLRIIQLRIEETLIYFLGNLGIAVLGFIFGLKYFWKKGQDLIFLLFAAGLISLFFPLFFNQRNSLYDIIQFASLGVIIFLILTPLLVNLKYRFLILLLLLFLSLPVTVKSGIPVSNASGGVTPAELGLLSYIKRQQGVVLVYPLETAGENSQITALTGAEVYFADEKAALITGKPVAKRQKEINTFFQSGYRDQLQFLKNNRLKLLLLKKRDRKYLKKIKVPYMKGFENEAASVYLFNL